MKSPLKFSWDPAKNDRNVELRGFGFSLAAEFDFETAVSAIDDRQDYGEVRYVAIGFIGERLHILVYTLRDTGCHIISLRKANKREVRAYVRKINDD